MSIKDAKKKTHFACKWDIWSTSSHNQHLFTSALGHASLRSSQLPRQWQIQCPGHKTGPSSEGWTPEKLHHAHFHGYKVFRLSPSSYTKQINSQLHGFSAYVRTNKICNTTWRWITARELPYCYCVVWKSGVTAQIRAIVTQCQRCVI